MFEFRDKEEKDARPLAGLDRDHLEAFQLQFTFYLMSHNISYVKLFICDLILIHYSTFKTKVKFSGGFWIRSRIRLLEPNIVVVCKPNLLVLHY
jgi:hypothetical protein